MIRMQTPDAIASRTGTPNTATLPMTLAEEQRRHALCMPIPRELRPMPLPFFRN